MHRFACERAVGASPPLVYFNCAEYAHNPELLSSHLFGHRQGAFTGANENKPGLVEQADGGYLLLDEVHRLPYEGQKAIFYSRQRRIPAAGFQRRGAVNLGSPDMCDHRTGKLGVAAHFPATYSGMYRFARHPPAFGGRAG